MDVFIEYYPDLFLYPAKGGVLNESSWPGGGLFCKTLMNSDTFIPATLNLCTSADASLQDRGEASQVSSLSPNFMGGLGTPAGSPGTDVPPLSHFCSSFPPSAQAPFMSLLMACYPVAQP